MRIPRTYPILVQASRPWESCGEDEDDWGGPEFAPHDVFVARYSQGRTVEEDELVGMQEVCLSPADDAQAEWGPGGRVLFMSDRDGDRALYSAKPGQRRPRLELDDPDLRSFACLADGTLLYTRPDGLWQRPAGSRAASRVDLGGVNPHSVCSNGSEVLLTEASSTSRGVHRLHRLDLGTGSLEPMGEGPFFDPALSPDGQSIAYLHDQEVRCRDLGTGAEKVLARSVPGWPGSAGFSPDGSRVFYTSWDFDSGVRGTAFVVPTTGVEPPRELMELEDALECTPLRIVPKH